MRILGRKLNPQTAVRWASLAVRTAVAQMRAHHIHTGQYSSNAFLGRLKNWCKGEIAAAFTAGHISAEEAIVIAYHRGRIVSNIQTKGAMVAVGLEKSLVEQYIQNCQLQKWLSIACINSPCSVTVSGDVEAADKLVGYLRDCDVFCRMLKTDGKAYHSTHMLSVGPGYEQSLSAILQDAAPLDVIQTQTQMISTVTGHKFIQLLRGLLNTGKPISCLLSNSV